MYSITYFDSLYEDIPLYPRRTCGKNIPCRKDVLLICRLGVLFWERQHLYFFPNSIINKKGWLMPSFLYAAYTNFLTERVPALSMISNCARCSPLRRFKPK